MNPGATHKKTHRLNWREGSYPVTRHAALSIDDPDTGESMGSMTFTLTAVNRSNGDSCQLPTLIIITGREAALTQQPVEPESHTTARVEKEAQRWADNWINTGCQAWKPCGPRKTPQGPQQPTPKRRRERTR